MVKVSTRAGNRELCNEKASYISKDEAKRQKHYVRKRTGRKVSVYRCEFCKCWHFTSIIEAE